MALFRPLAWEPPYAMGVALKKIKRPKKKKKKKRKKKKNAKDDHSENIERKYEEDANRAEEYNNKTKTYTRRNQQ